MNKFRLILILSLIILTAFDISAQVLQTVITRAPEYNWDYSPNYQGQLNKIIYDRNIALIQQNTIDANNRTRMQQIFNEMNIRRIGGKRAGGGAAKPDFIVGTGPTTVSPKFQLIMPKILAEQTNGTPEYKAKAEQYALDLIATYSDGIRDEFPLNDIATVMMKYFVKSRLFLMSTEKSDNSFGEKMFIPDFGIYYDEINRGYGKREQNIYAQFKKNLLDKKDIVNLSPTEKQKFFEAMIISCGLMEKQYRVLSNAYSNAVNSKQSAEIQKEFAETREIAKRVIEEFVGVPYERVRVTDAGIEVIRDDDKSLAIRTDNWVTPQTFTASGVSAFTASQKLILPQEISANFKGDLAARKEIVEHYANQIMKFYDYLKQNKFPENDLASGMQYYLVQNYMIYSTINITESRFSDEVFYNAKYVFFEPEPGIEKAVYEQFRKKVAGDKNISKLTSEEKQKLNETLGFETQEIVDLYKSSEKMMLQSDLKINTIKKLQAESRKNIEKMLGVDISRIELTINGIVIK